MTTQELERTPPTAAAPLTVKHTRRPVLRRAGAALMAALLAAAGLCAGDAVAGFFPFGPASRSISDLGNQYVPFYAYWWDVLHGHARGDLIVNWASGFGSSYLPDVFYYLASPFSLLVALVPRAEVDLAVYVITAAKIAAGAAVMAWYLRGLSVRGPFRSGLAAVFGAAYGLCGWAVTDAAYNPMWLDGLIAFPLLCIAGEWAMAGRRWVLGPLCVAFAWVTGFYTACFAMIGATVVLLIRAASETSSPRARLRGLGRAALYGGAGLGVAAPVVLVVYLAAADAWPVTPRPFTSVGISPMFARLLPGSYEFNSPAIFVGTFALFAALTLPFNRAVRARARIAWTVAIVAVAASMLWEPTVRIWYAYTTPNGSTYREAFVLSGMIVAAGWTSFARGMPKPYALAGGAALLGLTIWVASGWEKSTPEMLRWTWAVVAVCAVLYGVLALARKIGRRTWRITSGVLLVLVAAAQTAEAAANVADVDTKRQAALGYYAPWGTWHDRLRAAVDSADAWPSYRTDPGEARVTGNDPQLVGGEGSAYYSSFTSVTLIGMLENLGFGWISRGRSPKSLDNPVTDTVFSIAARAHSTVTGESQSRGGDQADVTLTRRQVAPLVTVRPASGPPPRYGASPFRNQELLLGTSVYTVPEVRYERKDGTVLGTTGPLETLPDPTPRSYPYNLFATCAPGQEVYLYAPDYAGGASLVDSGYRVGLTGSAGRNRAPIEYLGTVPATGRVKVKLRPMERGSVPDHPVACLDTARLADAVSRLRSTGATRVEVSGHSVTATLPAGSTGTAVMAVPAIRGWTCALGGAAARPAGNFLGLVSVPLDGKATRVSCSFTPPGLKIGLTITVSTVLAVAALWLGLFFLRRGRRRREGTAPETCVVSEAAPS
ncbi:YfhO family protein [Planotetraspora kaengkrachanensis]|uniref:Membrane protein n=1 Tax=Planotetraspora kaengkrachanensis TaxID=575193 RepID=A0A8J3PTN3_9ACTN|nr:YfhO family protein [Planotetraspora kaengkrachanensis]GIG80441.1 membrane protein [Planotetraspora kaengkrachanensis]